MKVFSNLAKLKYFISLVFTILGTMAKKRENSHRTRVTIELKILMGADLFKVYIKVRDEY